jgi:hypothetical protein
MAKFPVELGDLEGMVDAINYVLSGPSGLGQNFGGVSYSEPAWLTGNFRPPFTRLPFSTLGNGADTGTSITVSNPTGIVIGQYVVGTGIATGAQVDATYSTATPTTVPLTIANTGPVSGTINFYDTLPDNLYVAPIALSTSEWVDDYTRKLTFALAQATPPFLPGNSVTASGVSVAAYNQKYIAPGVVECTTTYVVVKSITPLTSLANGAGGTVGYFNTIQAPLIGVNAAAETYLKTDCSARATVTSPTDRVFVNVTFDNTIDYTATTNSDLQYTIVINRYLAISNNDPINPEFIYNFQSTIAERVYTTSVHPGTGSLNFDTVFGSIIDQPSQGLFLYRVDVQFRIVNTGGIAQVNKAEVRQRNLTAQVVKQ